MIVKLEQLNRIAKDLIKELDRNTFVLLNGDLGAGKTTFTKQLIKELGVAENVTSPSFNILNQYKAHNYTINHMDAYRLKKSDELDMFMEAFEEAINIIEWPKNLGIDFAKYGKVIEINILIIDEHTRDFEIKK